VCGKEDNVNYLNPCVAQKCARGGDGVDFTMGECVEPSLPEPTCVVDIYKGFKSSGSNHKLKVTKECKGGERIEYYAPYKKEACVYATESFPDKIGTAMTSFKTEGTCYRTIFVDDALCKTAHPDNVVIQGAGEQPLVSKGKHFCEIIVVLP